MAVGKEMEKMKSAIRNPQSAIRKGGKAFTLMELLIAIGILAVGGAMAAALFPAAIKENQSSYNDTLGTIICDNALATIKAIYTFNPSGTSGILDSGGNPDRYIRLNTSAGTHQFLAPQIGTDPDDWGYLDLISHYPLNDASDAQGFYYMALQHGSENDFTFVIIAYQKVSSDLPVFTPLTGHLKDTSDEPTNIIEVNDSVTGNFPINALVIIDSGPTGTLQGEYARVVRQNDLSGNTTEIILDHNLITPEDSNVDLWVFRDTNVIRSPAMNVLVARTPLRDMP